MTQAKSGDTVRIHYTGTLADGSVFDSSEGRDPLEFQLGSGQVIPGFDTGVTGMEVGEKKTGLDDDMELRERLLALYWELSAYREVPMMLAKLKAAGKKTAILSNGSPDMLEGAVESAGIGLYLDRVISVQDVGVFKPAAAVYELVEAQMGCTRDQVLFVSSNGWDAGCATGFGFTTAWVNRAGDPMDRLPWTPAHTLSDLTTIPEIAA